MKRLTILLVPALAIAVAACSSSAATREPRRRHPEPPAAATPAPSEAAMAKDIVETATEAGSFKTLLTAVKAAGLVETLQGEGPFTVFAPTDEAFAALPAGTLDGLLGIRRRSRRSSCTTSSRVRSPPTRSSGSPQPTRSRARRSPSPSRTARSILNDSAKVVTPDVMASNGVIHVIDKVILPPAD